MNKKLLFSGLNAVLSRLKALMMITDNFNRADVSGLGTVVGTTNSWSTIRGGWAIVSNDAYAATPSGYPVSTLTFGKTGGTIDIAGQPGVGTAFWVTDSNTWWATYQDVVQNCQTCYNTNTCAATYTGYNGNFAGYGVSVELFCPGNSCSWWAINPEYAWGLSSGGFCGQCGGECCYRYVSYAQYNPGNYFTYCGAYTGSNPYSCNCSNAYSIKLIKSISGTISNVATFAIGGIAASFRTIINGATGGITVRAYTNSNYTSQTGGDGTATATGFTATKKHGIIAVSTSHGPGQTNTISEFKFS